MKTPTRTHLIATALLTTLAGCAELTEDFFAGLETSQQPNTARPTPYAPDHQPGGGAATDEVQGITVNGRPLDQAGLQLLATTYNARPVPGDYWYDPVSGMWGRVGMPAEGYLYAGHDFGALRADASGGTSGVFVNGRILHDLEVTALTSFVGPVAPGRYWLDPTGNYGYEGYPVAVGNLYALAQQSRGGGGGGGDNFWSSRFSSGNWDSSTGAGYVQLPGGGFVTHGM